MTRTTLLLATLLPVDHDANTLVLETPLTWTEGTGVMRWSDDLTCPIVRPAVCR